MDNIVLKHPINAELLDELTFSLHQEGWSDPTGSIDWLRKHDSPEAMINGVRSLWKASTLPLHDWAKDIQSVEVVVSYCDLKLSICLSGGRIVSQNTPFNPEQLRKYIDDYPAPIPEIIWDIALVAPGLYLDNQGYIVEPCHIIDRLGYVSNWLKNLGTEINDVITRGYYYLDPDRHLMEIVTTDIGDCYIIGLDDAIWFFDHEEVGLVKCDINLEQFIHEYFNSPEAILDPFEMHWAERPDVESSCDYLDLEDTPLDIRNKKIDNMTNLARIALSIRGCQRAMPINYVNQLPPEWKKYDDILNNIINKCIEVATTSEPFSSKYVNEMCNIILEISYIWDSITKDDETDYVCSSFAAFALPALLRACQSLSDASAAEEAAIYCSVIKTIPRDCAQEDISIRSSTTDADYLLSLNLGPPGTIGKPVPPEVFERPLWCDSIDE